MILLDVFIKDGLDGLTLVEFVRSVREKSTPPEILFLPSAEAGGSTAVKAMRKGAFDHHLGKPSVELLDIALRALCAGRRASAAVST